MNVIGSPANTVILHWDECGTTWAQLPWRDWVRFRGFDDGGLSLLAGAEAGEHYFLVCVLDDRGELANVIPHRYVCRPTGASFTVSMGFARRSAKNIAASNCWSSLRSRTSERYNELDARGFTMLNLPPPHTVQPLLRALPGLAGAQPSGACWHFLSRSKSLVQAHGQIRATAAILRRLIQRRGQRLPGPPLQPDCPFHSCADQFDLHRARRHRLLMPEQQAAAERGSCP